jgi:hypothetical protein
MRLLFVSLLLMGALQLAIQICFAIARRVGTSAWWHYYKGDFSPVVREIVYCVFGVIVLTAVFAVEVALLMRIPFVQRTLLRRSVGEPATVRANGKRQLRCHPACRAFGWFFTAFSLFIFAGLVFAEPDGPATVVDYLPGAAMMAFFGIAGLSMITTHARFRLDFDDRGVDYVSGRGRAISFSWGEVESVQYAKKKYAWIIRLRDGRTASVSSDVIPGVNEFMGTLGVKTGLSVPPAGGRRRKTPAPLKPPSTGC